MIDERWDDDVEEIAGALAKMLAAESTSEDVRAAERDHDGASPAMQAQIEAFGLDQLEGSPALFARVAMEFGRSLASAPFVETMPILALAARPGVGFGFDGYVPAGLAEAAVRRDDGVHIVKTAGAGRRTAAGDRLVALDGEATGERIGDAALADRLERFAALVNAARIVGASQAMLAYAVNYVSEREQFGRPIGSFQAIQHKLADAVIDVDGSRFITYKAAWSLQEGEPDADLMISMAKAWTSDASRRVVAHGQQIHGGIGFTKEYKIQLYFRRQKWMELMWGDADYHREAVAQALEV